MKHTYASCWRLYVGATCNMARTTTEAASPGGEGQSMIRLDKKIFRYPLRKLSTYFYKASAGKGQAREAALYFFRSLLSVLRNKKEHYKARLTSFYIPIHSV